MNLGARRVSVPMGKIAARKTWRYESVVRSSSVCVQVAHDYRLEARRHAQTDQFAGMGACWTCRGGCDTRLRVGKSENGGYHGESNQRCKGPHCAGLVEGNQNARTNEKVFSALCLILGISY